MSKINEKDICSHKTVQKLQELLEEIKDKGLQFIVNKINESNHTDVSQDYFFIYEYEPNLRCIAHGRKKELIGKTPQEAQHLFSKINFVSLINGMKDIAKEGRVSPFSYEWRISETEPLRKKVSWIEPFEYQERKYFVGTGHYETNGTSKENGDTE